VSKAIWSYSFRWKDDHPALRGAIDQATKLWNEIMYIQRLLHFANRLEWQLDKLLNEPYEWGFGDTAKHEYLWKLIKLARLHRKIDRWVTAHPQIHHHPKIMKKIASNQTLSSGDIHFFVKNQDSYRKNPFGTRVGDYIRQRVSKNIKAYYRSWKAYRNKKIPAPPQFPRYIRKATIEVDQKGASIVNHDGRLWIKFNRSAVLKRELGSYPTPEIPISIYNDMFLKGPVKCDRCKTHPNGIKLVQRFRGVKIKPSPDGSYKISIGYDKRTKNPDLDDARSIGIDLGEKVLMGVVQSFTWDPKLISADPIRHVNERTIWQIANLQRKKERAMKRHGVIQARPEGEFKKGGSRRHWLGWNKKIRQISEKRKRTVDTYLHQVSSWLIQYCLEHQVAHVVIGYNKKWKTRMKQRNKTKRGTTGFYYRSVRRKFAYIPFAELIHKIEYKAAAWGIEVVKVPEEYTSLVSALDFEPIKHHKQYLGLQGTVKNGLTRGEFRTKAGRIIHSDVNAALNILRKHVGDEFVADLQKHYTITNPTFVRLPTPRV